MKIKLNDTQVMDLDKLVESRLLVQANSGGGKSWAIRRIIEQAFGHVQIIVLDPEGEFSNLRSEFDFVYVGKGGDAPAEPRAAALLAKRLLELKASAIIDLYELAPQDRKHFVRLFCEAMVNAPKELWHDTLVIIDEAHVFAPEKGESEAMGSVIDLATRGRKRGYCVILATQRLPKLNKDAAAECNNKLIGRASQDIDRKRASEELGFTSKEQILSLRDLDPGEFYVFGPAISREVKKITIGSVKVKPAKRGVSKSSIPAPSSSVKKILAQLKDLPQEAIKEAQTLSGLQSELRAAKTEIARLGRVKPTPAAEVAMGVSQWMAYGKKYGYWTFFEAKAIKVFKDALYQKLLKTHGNIFRAVTSLGQDIDVLKADPTDDMTPIPFEEKAPKKFYSESPASSKVVKRAQVIENRQLNTNMGEGERKVLTALAQIEGGITREHVTVITGYKRSTRDKYLYLLVSKGYAQEFDGLMAPTDEGMNVLGPVDPLPEGRELAEHYIRTLPSGESKVLEFLLKEEGGASREQISEATGFQRSTRDKYIYLLKTRQLVDTRGSMVQINRNLL